MDSYSAVYRLYFTRGVYMNYFGGGSVISGFLSPQMARPQDTNGGRPPDIAGSDGYTEKSEADCRQGVVL